MITSIRQSYLDEYYDIWRCFYDGSCPSGDHRDSALADLQSRYPDEMPPQERPSFNVGDWVGDYTDDISPIFGKVKDLMEEPDGWFINLIVYAPHGERIGRRSPVCGGPASFEPFVPADRFKRIEKPVFPIRVDKWTRRYQLTYL